MGDSSKAEKVLGWKRKVGYKELNGESCISIEELPQKKSICTSRSFANEGITDKNVIEEAVANFAVRCTEKLRRQGSVCQGFTGAHGRLHHVVFHGGGFVAQGV